MLLAALAAGCADKPTRPDAPVADRSEAPRRGARPPRTAPTPPPAQAGVPPACIQVREHRDEDYTPGGLYAPGVRDSAPEHALDISGIPEPEPRREAPSAFGNRTPYTVLGRSYHVMPSADGYVERGIASWYGQKFHGRQTSSREVYDMCSYSAAHKTLPLPSFVRVTRLDTGDSVVVRVNDRGPFHAGRIIDLSYAAAVRLGIDRAGTAQVEVRALDGARLSDAPAPPPTPTPVVRAPAASASPSPAAPVGAGSGRQIVQVGAYRDRDNARRIAGQLQEAGLDDVRVEEVAIDAGTVWRVRIGPVRAQSVAGVLDRLERLGFGSPRVFSE